MSTKAINAQRWKRNKRNGTGKKAREKVNKMVLTNPAAAAAAAAAAAETGDVPGGVGGGAAPVVPYGPQ